MVDDYYKLQWRDLKAWLTGKQEKAFDTGRPLKKTNLPEPFFNIIPKGNCVVINNILIIEED